MKRKILHRLTSWLRASVLAGAVALLGWPLTVTSGVLAAVLGALSGAVLADHLERPRPAGPAAGARVRLASALLAAFAVAAIGLAGTRWLASTPWIAAAFGPVATLHLSEATRWFFLAAPGVFAVRFLARRRPILELLEALVVGVAIVTGLASHRDGMVHRPLAIGDWAWSQGLDPVLVFLALGGAATLLLSALLISEERRRRLPLHFSSLVLVAVVLLMIIRVGGLPKPQPSGDLGLTGDPEEQQEGEGSGQGGEGDPDDQLRDLDFRDDYGSSGGQAPVAVVVLHDDYTPPAGVYYFRQSAFSQYNGHKLVQALRRDVDQDVLRHFPAESLDVPSAPPASGGRRPLRTSMGLLVDHVRPFALDSPARVRSIRNPDPLRFRRAFEVRSHVQTLPYRELLDRRPGDADWDEEQWDHYLEAPRDPRYRELAEALRGTLRDEYRRDPLGQALAVKSYLDKEGIYSRRSSHAGADDPAASFLFGDLTGYCVHFAHAATYLLRSMDLPARVAAGYAVAEASRGTSSAIMIRGGDAHAWPEVYLEDVGWVVVDLSPERTLDEPNAAADPDLQRMLGEMMRQQMWSDDELEEGMRQPFDLAAVGRFLGLVLLVLVAAAYLVKIYRSLVPSFARTRHLYRVGYRAALDRLADVGLRRRYGESRERFAARARQVSPAFARLTGQHVAAALGSRRVTDAEGLRGLVRRTAEDLRARVPAWRRFLGAVNPVSWILIK